MFTVTALGHQGWLLGSGRSHVLIDPLLTPRFSRMPKSAATVWPPRAMSLAEFPPIDAVFISHEHPDHLDFASLQRLDRRTPVYLSAHSSDAARQVVSSLGLEVGTLTPGVAATVGDLSVLPFAPRDVGGDGSNEIDVVPMLVRDRAGHGSFFTSVDLPASTEWAREVRRHLDRPGVWVDGNSSYDRSVSFDWCRRMDEPVEGAARLFAERYVSTFDGWGHPELVMVTDNGLTLGGDLAFLNAHVFEVSTEALVDAVAAQLPGHVFRAARPGTTAELIDGTLAAIRTRTPFLATDDAGPGPVRGGAPLDSTLRLDFSPGTGRRTLRADEYPRLERALAEFGKFLFGRGTFRGLYRLMCGRDYDPHLRPTAALALRDGEPRRDRVYEYRPTSSSFVRVECADPVARYVAGAEFWASDLLAALTFEVAPDDLFHFGRKRVWNAAHAAFRCDLDTEVELFAHALHNTDALEALYRAGLDREIEPVLRGSQRRTDDEWPGSLPARKPNVRPVPEAFASSRGPGAHEEAPVPTPTPEEEQRSARLSAAVSRGSDGAWTLAAVAPSGSGLRLTLAVPDQTLILTVAPRAQMPRHYRAVNDLAFAYGGADLPESLRSTLDRVIDHIASMSRED